MGWFSRLSETSEALNDLSKAQDRSTLVSIADPLLFEKLGLVSFGSPHVTEHTAMSFSAVYRCVSIIASSIAGLEFGVYRRDDNGIIVKSGSYLDDPYRLRSDMPPIMTKFEWHELMVVWLLLHGNFYAEKLRNAAGEVVALQPIHPRCVQVKWDSTYLGGRKYTVTDMSGETHKGGAERFFHVLGISLDGLVGISVITAARMAMGIGLVADTSAFKMFDRGATISGLVTPSEGEVMSPDDVETVQRYIRDTMTGVENTGDIAVTNRRLNFTKWTMSAQDAQFLESRQFQIDDIGRWYGVPSHLLNLAQKSTSWGPGIAEQNNGLARFTLKSWTDRIAARTTTLAPRGSWSEYRYDTFLKPEPIEFQKSLIELVKAGLMTANEARQAMNMAPKDGGDELKANGPVPATPVAGEIGSEPQGK